MSTPSRQMSGRHLGGLCSAAILLLIMALAPLGCSKSPSSLAPTSPNLDPLATAKVSPDSGAAPLAVRFDGAVSDVDGSIVSSQWDFGDGTTSDALVADHVYEGAGTYTAKLVATDDRGATALAMLTVRVKGNKAPTATIGASPMSGPAPLTVSFTGTGTDVDGTVVTYQWNFGDGSSSTEQNLLHTYVSPGSYNVRLVVTDNNGSRGRDMVKVSASGASNQPPSATASGMPTTGTAPLTVNFSGSGTDPDGTVASYAWTFGDGGTSTLQNPSHTYTTAGTYVARLTVTDNLGATAAATVTVTVDSAPTPTNLAPVANAGPDQLNKDPGTAFTLSAAGSSDPDGAIAGYAWAQISGPTVTLSGAGTATASFTSPTRTTATYGFRLTVTDNGSPALSRSDTVLVATRVTYLNTVAALLQARGTQSNGQPLGCTSCHSGSGGRTPLTTYAEVYSARTAVKSRISSGGSMLQYLQSGEAPVIISWIDAGAPEKN